MASPTTALQLIEDGLALTNSVGADQTLTADEVALGLRAFNDVLEAWSIDDLAVYATQNITINTAVGQTTYTIGTGGNWNVQRPVFIREPSYIVYQNVSFYIKEMTQEQYNGIALKTQQSIIPEWFLYENTFPLGLVTLWPVPSQILPITFSVGNILSAVASAGTTISFPPGYAKGFLYNLAVELAPYFGKQITKYPDIIKTYKDTMGLIKRANLTPAILKFDPQALGGSNIGWNYSGYPY